MWRKLRSSKDDVSFFQELKKEFKPQVDSVGVEIKAFFDKHPKQIIIGMMVVVGLSAILSFLVLIPMEKKRLKEQLKASERLATDRNKTLAQPRVEQLPGNNIDDVISATSRLQKGFAIKQEVDAILAQPELTRQDSLRLNTLLDSLKSIKNLN